MRIINDIFFCFVNFLFVVLFLLAGAQGQTQGFAPYVPDGYESSREANVSCTPPGGYAECTKFVEGIQQDDFVMCVASQEFAPLGSGCNGGSPPIPGTNPPWTMIDSLGNSLNMQTSSSVNANNTPMQVGYLCAASSNSTYNVSWNGEGSFCQASFDCFRVKNLCSGGSVTMDGARQTDVGTATSLNTGNTTLVTTALNDVLIEVGTKSNTGGGVALPNNSGWSFINDNPGMGQLEAWMIAPVFGSNAANMLNYNIGGSQLLMQSFAFKVPAMLGDSAMPQGGVGTAYAAQLHCYGVASATPSYFLLSGSVGPGLSFNSDGSITGTPTTAGFYTFTANCTGGGTISSNRTLTIQIGAALNTITIDATTLSTNFNTQPLTFTVNASCGDLIDIRSRAGDDTHFGQGYLQTINGTFSYVHDDVGSQVQTFQFNGGDNRGPMVEWVIGPVLQAGTRTISVANGTGSSSGIAVYQTLIHGAQSVLDINNATELPITSPTTTMSLPLTLTVPNELVYVQFSSSDNTSSTTTFSATTGSFSVDNTQNPAGNYAAGHAFITSPVTTTITANTTHPAGACGGFSYCDQWSFMATAFRPGLSFSCPISPAPRHRSLIQ